MREAFFEQVFEDMFDFARAADHADVFGVRFKGCTKGVLIKVMPAGDDDDPGGFIWFQVANGLGDVAKGQLHFFTEDERVGEVAAISYDDDAKIKLSCQAGEGLGDVTRAGKY